MSKYYYNHLTGPILDKDSEEKTNIRSEDASPLFATIEEALEHQKQSIYSEMKRLDGLVSEKEKEIAELLSSKDEIYIFLYKRDQK